MAQLPPPVLLALIPSEVVHIDPQMRYSALNFLSFVRVASFPSTPQKIGVFIAVAGIRIPTRIDVELVGPNGNPTHLCDWDLMPSVPVDPLEVHQMGANAGMWYTDPGEYLFRAIANGSIMGEWKITVSQ